MKCYLVAVLMVVLLSLTISPASARPENFQLNSTKDQVTITIAADYWCPFNCQPNSEYPGYMIEIAQQVFALHDITVNYQIIPWSRALQLCRAGRISAVVGGYKSDAPDFIYPQIEQGMIGFSFFSTMDHSWQYQGITSLDNQLLAVADGYAYSETLDRYIGKYQDDSSRIYSAFGDKPLTENIALLEQGLIDVLIETKSVFWYRSEQLNKRHKFIMVGVLAPAEPAYISFSPAIDESRKYARLLSQGTEQLRASGELSKILAKYGLSDWQE